MRSRDLVNSLALPLLLTLAAPANWALRAVGQAPLINTTQIYWTDPNDSGNPKPNTSLIKSADTDGTGIQNLVTGLHQPRGMTLDQVNGKMYWTEPGSLAIRRANLDGTAIQTVVAAQDGVAGVALDVQAGKIYWTDVDGALTNGMIRRADLDGSNAEDLLIFGPSHPVGIALDLINDKIYWTDLMGNLDGTGAIRRSELDGSNLETLLVGIDEANGIAVDPIGGKIYWPELVSDKIQRANLDGSGVEDLVVGLDNPTTIALDLSAGMIYWTDSGGSPKIPNRIERANLDGSDSEVIVSGVGFPWGIAVYRATMAPKIDPAGQPQAVAQQDAERQPVPDAEARLEARQLIEEVFSEDFAAAKKSAKTPAKRSELAKKLLQLARETEDDPVGRFTLLAMSRELATGAGDLQGAFAAIMDTAKVYDLPALPVKAKVLAALAKQPMLPTQLQEVAEAALPLVDEAMAVDDYALAGQLADLAVASAKKAKNFPFARQVIARKKEVDRLRQEFAAVNEAMIKLATTPDDPAANLAVGRFRCFVKNDWQSGIPMLVLGSDAALKQLAIAELEESDAAEVQLRIADAWWAFAAEQSGRAQQNTKHHAGTWYGRALPQLTGLAKAKAEKRARGAPAAIPLRISDNLKLPPGAVLLMTFDRPTREDLGVKTIVRDVSGNGHHGEIENPVFEARGKIGECLDCSKGKMRLPNSFLNKQSSFTFTAWVFVRGDDALDNTIYKEVIRKSLPIHGIYFDKSGRPTIGAWNIGKRNNWVQTSVETKINPSNRWIFFAAVLENGGVDSGNIRLYVDNKVFAMRSQMTNHPSSSYAEFGRFDGLLDEVSIYQRALSDDEIKTIRQMGLRGQSLAKAKAKKRLSETLAAGDSTHERDEPAIDQVAGNGRSEKSPVRGRRGVRGVQGHTASGLISLDEQEVRTLVSQCRNDKQEILKDMKSSLNSSADGMTPAELVHNKKMFEFVSQDKVLILPRNRVQSGAPRIGTIFKPNGPYRTSYSARFPSCQAVTKEVLDDQRAYLLLASRGPVILEGIDTSQIPHGTWDCYYLLKRVEDAKVPGSFGPKQVLTYQAIDLENFPKDIILW